MSGVLSTGVEGLSEGDALSRCSVVFKANWDAVEFTVVNQGGTSSGKTYSILQVLILRAIYNNNLVITVVGESIPMLKTGAYLDIERIYDGSEFFRSNLATWNKTDRVLVFKSGSRIQFNSYDTITSASSGKRDYLFINEANGLSYDFYWQLSIRTKVQVFLDYNPTVRFWVHDNVIGKEGVKFLRSDHRHNPFLTQHQHDAIESDRATNYERWRVYARGYTGNVVGLIYPHWTRIPDSAFPWDDEGFFGGIDYGYTNDPTAIVKIVKNRGDLYLHEIAYETGISNDRIRDYLIDNGFTYDHMLYSEHDKDAISELRRANFTNVIIANKSINPGISTINRHRVYYTESSVNIHEERSRYMWERAKDTSKYMNVPIDRYNHLMDAIRYGVHTRYFDDVGE